MTFLNGKTKHTYTTPDGTTYPLYEAPYQYKITVYKSDCKKAVVGDPEQCLIAKGAARDRDVLSAHVGSGKIMYLVFKAKGDRPAHALRYILNAKACRVRDGFDQKKAGATQVVTLLPPTPGRTKEYQAKLAKRRAKEIAEGSPVKHRGSNRSRVERLGVARRPSAITDGNNTTLLPRTAETSLH